MTSPSFAEAAQPVRHIPLHIADGRLLGGLDLNATLLAGRPVAERGLLAEADGGVLVLAMAERLPIVQVPLSAIRELDETYWYDHGYAPTCRSVAEHALLIDQVDLSFPILLSSDGRVMDGMHRVAKALIRNQASLPARQFAQDPEPDHVGVAPDDLPYEN